MALVISAIAFLTLWEILLRLRPKPHEKDVKDVF